MAESIALRTGALANQNDAIELRTLIATILTDLTAVRAPLAGLLKGSATYDPPSLLTGVGATTTITVTGVALGDFAMASFSLDLQGISVTAYVSAADTVSVRFHNGTAGTLDLLSGTLRVAVLPQSSFAAPSALTLTS